MTKRTTKRERTHAAPAPPVVQRRERVWPLRLAAVLLALLGVIPMANFVTTGAGLPWWSNAVRQWATWLVVVAIVALLLGRFAHDRIEATFDRAKRILLAPSSGTFAVIAGAMTCALSLYFGWRVFGLEPVVGDEFSQRWQAHLLANGHLLGRVEARPEFFSTVETLEVGGRWFAQFPMGGPALLALGMLARAVWLLNPLLAGIAAIALYDFARQTMDEVTARSVALLFALCPFVLLMAGSQMNHVPTMAAIYVALAALARWFASDSPPRANRTAAVIGGCIGLAATIRPFDAAVVATVFGVFQLRHMRLQPWRIQSLLVQAAVGLVPVLLLLAANRATVGSAFSFAYDVLNGPEHRPGFHNTPLGFAHTPLRGLYMASAYLMKLDVGLFAWPVPAVLVVVIALLAMVRATRWDGVLLAILVGFIAGYAVYWSESYFVGPRFLFTAAPILVLYTARMPSALRQRVQTPWLRAAVLLFIPLWLLIAWLSPPRENQLFGVRGIADLYRMRATAPTILAAVKQANLSNAVVFIPEGWHARLAARLRPLDLRPLSAEQLVKNADACTLQRALDTADRIASPSKGQRLQVVLDAVRGDGAVNVIPGLPPSDQIAFVPGRALSAECSAEISQLRSLGVSIAEMLPYQGLDASGAVGGSVVYARDFGARNELLRHRFGNRDWYVARIAAIDGELSVKLEVLSHGGR